jgi:hypothetical protein
MRIIKQKLIKPVWITRHCWWIISLLLFCCHYLSISVLTIIAHCVFSSYYWHYLSSLNEYCIWLILPYKCKQKEEEKKQNDEVNFYEKWFFSFISHRNNWQNIWNNTFSSRPYIPSMLFFHLNNESYLMGDRAKMYSLLQGFNQWKKQWQKVLFPHNNS